MTERFYNDGDPLSPIEQSEWQNLSLDLLSGDAGFGATLTEYNTAAKTMIPPLSKEPHVSETEMLLPDEAIGQDEDGFFVNDADADPAQIGYHNNLLKKDPWHTDADTGWKPSGTPSPKEVREAMREQRQLEAKLPWYRRSTARILGATCCFGAITAAIVAGSAGWKPASPTIPDVLVLKNKVARDPALLKELGVCASELRAQRDLEDDYLTRPTERQRIETGVLEKAIQTAERAHIPCTSTSGQESVRIEGAQISRSDITIYKDTNWCDQRKEIARDFPLNTDRSRGEVLAVGNRYFGKNCK